MFLSVRGVTFQSPCRLWFSILILLLKTINPYAQSTIPPIYSISNISYSLSQLGISPPRLLHDSDQRNSAPVTNVAFVFDANIIQNKNRRLQGLQRQPICFNSIQFNSIGLFRNQQTSKQTLTRNNSRNRIMSISRSYFSRSWWQRDCWLLCVVHCNTGSISNHQ